MNEKHVFHVDEDGWASHWVTAESELEAERFVAGYGEAEDGATLEARQLPSDQVFTVTLSDTACDPEDPDVRDWLEEDGFTVDLSGKCPTVSAPCHVWANHSPEPSYLSCSEW